MSCRPSTALGFQWRNQGSSRLRRPLLSPVLDEAFSGFDIPEGNQDQASPLAEQLMELYVSFLLPR